MADRLSTVHLDDIHPVDDNLRATLGDIDELAKSIASVGLLQPIRVQKNGDGYKVIAGHRRLAALHQLHAAGSIDPDIKVIIGNQLDDSNRTAAMLIENMQRVDLNLAEEVEGVRRLVQEYGMTQADVATHLGVTKQWVQDRVAMLALDQELLTKPKHADTDKPLPVASLVQLAKLPSDVQDRLTKDGKVPSEYEIEDRQRQVAAKKAAAKELKTLTDKQVMAVTEKQLKRIVKTDYAELSGIEQLVKVKLGTVNVISEEYYRTPKEPTIILKQVFGRADINEFEMDKVYVLKESGYPKWYTATVEGARADEGEDEYELACAEVDARNEAKLEAWEDAKYDTLVHYVQDTKAAQLTADVVHHIIFEQLSPTAWRSYDKALRAASLLGIEPLDIPQQSDRETDEVYTQRVRDTKAEQCEVVLAYARKNGTQMIRVLATLYADKVVELPKKPELEDYPDDPDHAEF